MSSGRLGGRRRRDGEHVLMASATLWVKEEMTMEEKRKEKRVLG